MLINISKLFIQRSPGHWVNCVICNYNDSDKNDNNDRDNDLKLLCNIITCCDTIKK